MDRLITGMEELGIMPPDLLEEYIFITIFKKDYIDTYIKIADRLRKSGYKVDLYTGTKNIRGQLGYASEKGYRWAIIAGDQEIENEQFILKDMANRTEIQIKTSEIEKIKDIIK